MFSISGKNENGFAIITLLDESTETAVEVIPGCGAILHSFAVLNNKRMLNVIDSYDSATDFKDNLTAKGFKSSKLSPFVCRLKDGRYSFGKENYHIEKFYLGSSALHGLIYDAAFTTEEQFADETRAAVKLKYEYRAEDGGYPFDYDCIVTYELKKENTLSITTQVVNKDKGIIPVADGWHPYFTFGDSINELQLEFQSKSIIEFDTALIPNGKEERYEEFGSLKEIGDTQFDNCFLLNFAECQPMCVLRSRKEKLQVEIIPDKSYPYLQVYTPPHRNSIAIENLSAQPDAFNNGKGLLVLQPGETASFTTTYTISSLT